MTPSVPVNEQAAEVVDGFSYNPFLNFLPGWWMPHVLGEMGVLRRANNYRPRFYCVLDAGAQTVVGATSTYVTIPAYQTVAYRVSITPKAYLWGYNLFVQTANRSEKDVAIQIQDEATGIKLFQDFVIGSVVTPFAYDAVYAARVFPVLLSRPRYIGPPGDVVVEIANRTGQAGDPDVATDLTVQMMLCTSEPCRLIADDQRVTSGRIVR